MATIVDWGLRMVVSLAGLVGFFANWRLGLVLLFAVALDFVTMIGMVLPGASIRQEVLLVFAATLPLGVLGAVPSSSERKGRSFRSLG